MRRLIVALNMAILRLWIRYNRFEVNASTRSTQIGIKDISFWREKIFSAFIIYLLPIGFLALIPGIYMAIKEGGYAVALIDFLAAASISVVIFNKRIRVGFKKIFIISIFYLLAIFLVVSLGSFGPGIIYLLAVTVFVSLIFNYKVALWSVFTNVLICLFFAAIIQFKLFGSPLITTYSLGAWLAYSGNLIFLSFISVILINKVINGLERTIIQLSNSERELKLSSDDLYKRNKELQTFGYVVSHNLRSPVANILGLVNVLELDLQDPELAASCINDLKASTQSLDHVIRDLSDVLSIADTETAFIKEQADIVEIILAVKNDLAAVIQQSGTQLHIPLAPCMLLTHKAYLYSIFYNLIANAIKYRSAQPPEIAVGVECQEDFVTIRVTDNGSGIDLEKHINDLFKPYKRFHLHVVGKGLGLFLIKSHVGALNGEITVESKPGSGSTFTVILPTK
jgi:signal transduction histidine kinase